jgi:hypothetical protein
VLQLTRVRARRRRSRPRRTINPGTASTGHPRETRPKAPRTSPEASRTAERKARRRTRATLGDLGRDSQVSARVGKSKPLNKSSVYRRRRKTRDKNLAYLRRTARDGATPSTESAPSASSSRSIPRWQRIAQHVENRREARAEEREKDDGGGGLIGAIKDVASVSVDDITGGKIGDVADTKIASLPDNSLLRIAQGKPGTTRDVTVLDAALLAAPGVGKAAQLGAKAAGKTLAARGASKAPKPRPKPANAPKPGPKLTRPKSKTGPASSKLTPLRAFNDDHALMAVRGAPKAASKAKPQPYPITEAAKKVAASKPAQATAQTAKKVAKKKSVQKTGRVLKTGSRPVRYPLRKIGKHPILSTGAALEAPVAVKAAKGDSIDAGDFTAPITGTAKALVENPGQVGKTTLRTLPGLVTAPVGMAANLGLTGYRAVTDATGLKDYTGKEILAPTKETAKAVGEFIDHYADVYGSGDKEKIQKATEDEFGIGMLLPLTGALRKGGVGTKAGEIARKVKGVRAIPALNTRRLDRRERAREAARTQREGAAEALGRASKRKDKRIPGLTTIANELRQAKGSRGTLKKRDRDKHLVATEDTIKTLAEEGITLPRHAKRLRERYPERPKGEGEFGPVAPKDRATTHDVARKLDEESGDVTPGGVMTDPHVKKALEDYREFQRDQATEIPHSAIATNIPQATTWDVPLPWDRTLAGAKSGTPRHVGNSSYFKNDKTPEETAVNAQLEAEFLADMKALREGRLPGRQDAKGLAEPIWTHDANIMDRGPSNLPGSVRGFQGRSSYAEHQNMGKLQKAGTADPTWEQFAQGSIIEPPMKRAINANTSRFVEENFEPIPIGKNGAEIRTMTQKQADAAGNRGLVPEDAQWIDTQAFKSAVLDPRVRHDDVALFRQSVAKELEDIYARKAGGDPTARGRVGGFVTDAKLKEFLRQHHRAQGDVAKWLGKSQRAASSAILGYNPSWMIAQPIAEAAQGLGAVGVTNQLRGLYSYGKMAKKEQQAWDSVVQTPGLGHTRDVGVMYSEVGPATSRLGQALRRSQWGKVADGLFSGRGVRGFDAKKAQIIRRAVDAGNAAREFDKMRFGVGGLMKFERQLAGKTRPQAMAWLAKNPKARKMRDDYLSDVMGNWDALTSMERSISHLVIFYPFVRMSVAWTLSTFPKAHPLKAAGLHFLAQQNAEKIQDLLGGDPSFFTGWAQAPIYSGRGKNLGQPSSMLPLHRIAPGSNTLIEALGGDASPRDFLRAANPFLGAAVAGIGGYDQLTGRNLLPQYSKVSIEEMARNYGAQMLNMVGVLRIANTAIGKEWIKKVGGRDVTGAQMLFDQLAGNTLVRAITPFVPNRTSKERQKAEIGRLMARSFDKPDWVTEVQPALLKLQKANQKDIRGTKAEENILRYLDALVAKNQLAKAYEHYGIPAPPGLKEPWASASDAASDVVIPKTWNAAMEKAKDAGLPYRRTRKLRRARARSLMGNS